MTDEPGAAARRARLALPAVALAATALAGWSFARRIADAPPTTFDDAYMYARYAKQLLAGHGVAWNPDGVQTYGATNLVWMFVVAALRGATSWADATLLRAGSVFFALASLALLVATACRFSRSGPLTRSPWLWLGVLAPALLASEPFVYHALTGMGTMLSLFVNCVLIFATLRMVERRTPGSVAPVVLAAWLAYLTRPDNGIYAVVFPSAAAFLLVPAGERGRLVRTFLIGIVGVLAVDAAVKQAVFGTPVPLPSYAKMHGHFNALAHTDQWNPMGYLLEFTRMALPFLAVLILCAGQRSRALLAVFLLPAAATLAYYFGVTQIMGYRARFSFPSVAYVVVAAALALDGALLERGAAAALVAAGTGARLVVAVALIGLLPAADRVLPGWYARRFMNVLPTPRVEGPLPLAQLTYWQAMESIASIATRAPAGSVFALSEYGYPGAAAPEVTILDPLGLHDAEVARHGFSSERLLAGEPDLIWFPHPDYVGMRANLLADETLWAEYDVWPAAFRFGVALRREGPRAARFHELFAAAWKWRYPGEDMESHRARR